MEQRRPPIKPVSRDAPKKKKASLKDCKCFDEIERQMRMGLSSSAITKFIHEERGEFPDLAESYVKRLVDDHRKSIPPLEIAMSSGNTLIARNAKNKVMKGLDELEELTRLYDLQSKRVEIDFENEKKINKLFPTTGREIYYAMKILKQSAELKMDLGLMKRNLGEVSVTAQAATVVGDRYNEGVAQSITDPDSRRKVLSLVESLMQLSAKSDIDAMDVVNSAINAGDVIDVAPVEPESPPVPESTDSAEE